MSSSASSRRRGLGRPGLGRPGLGRPGLGRRGTSTLEFALVAAMLLTAFAAIFEIARWEATRVSLRAATAEVLRAALLDPALDGCATPWTRVASRVPMLEAGRVTLCVTRGTGGGLQQVTVTTSYAFSFAVPIFGAAAHTMTDNGLVRF